jgi:galactose mutarotase-like enzyme
MEIEISNGRLTARINTKGAELISLTDIQCREYIWEGNPQYWGKHSPVLFPIVGTLKNNAYKHNGKEYSMTRHGFARDKEFSVTHPGDDTVIFTLSDTDEIRKVYPFRFTLELAYTLKGNLLELTYSVTNNGAEIMPFSLGAHPAFAMPGNFEDYSLRFEKDNILRSTQLQNDLISDSTVEIRLQDDRALPLNYALFKNDALIFKSLVSRTVELLKKNQAYLRVSFTDFPHLGIWTKQGAPFLCIEPWQGYSDHYQATGNITEKEGIVTLLPYETSTRAFKIEILH